LRAEQALVERMAGSQPAEHKFRVLRACGAVTRALERTGQWQRSLRLFYLLRAHGLDADAAAFDATIRALGQAEPAWLRPLQLERYDEMLTLGLQPSAESHAVALRLLERDGPRSAERAARVRRALACARLQTSGRTGGVVLGAQVAPWPPLRYGKQGGEQTRHGHVSPPSRPGSREHVLGRI